MKPYPDDAYTDPNNNVWSMTGRWYGVASDFEPPTERPMSGLYRAMTPGDLRRQQEANARSLGVAAGIGAAGTAAQVGLSLIPTATDVRNDAALADFEAKKQAGQLGLSADQRAVLQRALLNPARAALTEARQHTDARLASMGNTSAGAQRAAEAASRDSAIKQETQAGIEITRQDIEERRRQEQENEERIAEKGKREAGRINAIGQAIGQVAEKGGAVLAAQAERREPYDAEIIALQRSGNDLEIQGKSVGEARAILEARRKANRKGIFDVTPMLDTP